MRPWKLPIALNAIKYYINIFEKLTNAWISITYLSHCFQKQLILVGITIYWNVLQYSVIQETMWTVDSLLTVYPSSWNSDVRYIIRIIIWRKVVFAVIGLVSRNTKGCTTRSEKTEVYMKALVDMVAIAAQATGFVVWPFLEARQRPNLWLIPVSLFCISCGWWENYVAKNSVISESHSQIKP